MSQTVPKTRPTDRRVERTQRLLHRALIDLIRERGWDAITVQDLCEHADVGRSTFYAHFGDKEDLLISGFAELRRQLRERAVADTGTPLAYTRALLEHTHEYEPIYRALLGRRTAEVVRRAWIEVLSELLDEDLAKVIAPGALRDAAIRYLAGAMWELLGWWGEQPKRAAVIDVAAIYRRLTIAVVRELRR